MEDSKVMTIIDENGQEKEVEIILTFEDDKNQKSYVLFTDVNSNDGNVYAYSYDEDGNMNEITDEAEWEMCQEVLGAFLEEDE
jgi:YD repeat-containing protein